MQLCRRHRAKKCVWACGREKTLSAFARQKPAACSANRFAIGFGAAYVTRTRDPIITNDVLYQLS